MRRLLLVATVPLLSVIAAAAEQSCRATEARAIATAKALLHDGILRVVVVGDSVARGAGDERGLGITGSLDAEFRKVNRRAAAVVNLGVNGARTSKIRNLIEQTTAACTLRTADVIIVSIGGNDLYGDSRARLVSRILPSVQQHRTLARIDRLVARMREINPAARVYLLGLYNPYRRSSVGGWLHRQVNLWDARLITRFASARGVLVLRICDLLEREERISTADRFHPGSSGYQAIASRIVSSM